MGVPGLLPRWLCYTLNMLYFTFFPLLEAALTYYMAYLIHGRGPCFTRVAICLGVMLAAALAVVFTNPFTGWLFYLDAAGTYVRGPYNRLLYALLVACCLLLVICYIKQFRMASRAIHRMMATLTPSGDGAGDGAVSVPARHDDGLYPGVHFAGADFFKFPEPAHQYGFSDGPFQPQRAVVCGGHVPSLGPILLLRSGMPAPFRRRKQTVRAHRRRRSAAPGERISGSAGPPGRRLPVQRRGIRAVIPGHGCCGLCSAGKGTVRAFAAPWQAGACAVVWTRAWQASPARGLATQPSV